MSVYQYFKRYVEYGIVPARRMEGYTLAPESSFYKSVHYIDNVLGPVKDIICGVENEDDHNNQYMKSREYVGYRAGKVYPLCQLAAFLATSVVLQPLLLTVAYLSYFPFKLFSKITGDNCLKASTRSLVDHSNVFLDIGQECATAVSKVFNKIVSYICAAVVWAAALIITPFVWACNKVQSKLSEIQEPEKTSLVNGIPHTEL
ncbi:MAG: hypothetical protein LBJ80_01175 [Rickettsiales bacterium]|jgi:hypothetical protein|nr:hypothetical protein [Rickettsiales bacterium]MDR1261020.1 hypothetical protein [Rickettsiales bacterium]